MGGEAYFTTLGASVDLMTGFPFKSEHFSDDLADVRLLRGDNVAQGVIRWAGAKRWPASEAPRDYLLRPGDVVLAMDRPWIEAGLKHATLTDADCPSLLVQRVACLRARPGLDQRFLGYLIRSQTFTDYVLSVQTGTAVPHISGSQIRAFRFKLLPLPLQEAVGRLLGALDEKIELNRRIANTLEATARAWFKSWFVDFESVRAKVEGRHTGLPDDLAALFPSRLTADGVPEGWGRAPLSSMVEIVSGGTPKTSTAEFWDGDIPWYSVVDVPAAGSVYVLETERSITEAGLAASPAQLVDVDTTIISARGTVGKLALTAVPMAFNQSCYGIRGTSGLPPRFIYCLMQDAVAGLEARSHGSVFSTITRDTFDAIHYPAVPVPLAQVFESFVDPIFARLRLITRENRNLAALRDTLLPKLISGELRVRNAEQAIAEVA